MSNKRMEAVLAQTKPVVVQEKKFSKEVLLTKYFNPIVDKKNKQTEAVFKVRIIPFENEDKEDTTFMPLKVHTGLKLGNEWQKFICLSENNETCPLCQTEEGLRLQGEKESAKDYQAKDHYVVKVIDRSKEQEGIKFWRFKKKYDGTGVLNKIATLMTLYEDMGDILDPKTGYDLIITCNLDAKGYSVISSINIVKPSPLADTDEKIQALLNDDTTWRDVYTPKTAKYLTEVVNGTASYWDKKENKMVNPATLVQSANVESNSDNINNNPLLSGEKFDITEIEQDPDDLPF